MTKEPETYSESAIGIVITRERALRELEDHNIPTFERASGDDWRPTDDLRDFFAEVGDHDTYLASDVLAWLGY
jgi:hypothetical protein